jgi:hypothetical protein
MERRRAPVALSRASWAGSALTRYRTVVVLPGVPLSRCTKTVYPTELRHCVSVLSSEIVMCVHDTTLSPSGARWCIGAVVGGSGGRDIGVTSCGL